MLTFLMRISVQFLAGFRKILQMAKRLHATHHARWMETCIYLLNIVLCSDFFDVGARLADKLVLCFYVIYVHFWYFLAP